jgi:hypothetical protein
MKATRTRKELFGSRKAFVTVYMVFATLVMVPMVGLAIDISVLYNVKSRLQEACDAGAIGAGNLVQRSTDVTDPTTNTSLKASVLRYFNANFSPAPWSASQMSYNSAITQDATTKVRTIYVGAKYQVPMLFMRVLGINTSQVAAEAIAKLRFINLVVVVDRSGSVNRTSTGGTSNSTLIESNLITFIGDSTTSVFKDGRDVVGLVSFGGAYNVDFTPQTNFQTASPNISTAINNLRFGNNATNTGEGLYQAWYQLAQLNQNGALNAVVLITDGRPSAFTASFAVNTSTSSCTDRSNKQGVITAVVGLPFPPASSVTKIGVEKYTPACDTSANASCESDKSNTVSNNGGCAFASTPSNVTTDITIIPTKVGPQDHTTGTLVPSVTQFDAATGYYPANGAFPRTATDATDAASVRYTSSNYAYNVAQAMRTDTTLTPVIYCIGLNWDPAAFPTEEPLDADFLATLANDPDYKSTGKPSGVYQTGQTSGKYYNITYSGLGAALQDIAGQILRLAAH